MRKHIERVIKEIERRESEMRKREEKGAMVVLDILRLWWCFFIFQRLRSLVLVLGLYKSSWVLVKVAVGGERR